MRREIGIHGWIHELKSTLRHNDERDLQLIEYIRDHEEARFATHAEISQCCLNNA